MRRDAHSRDARDRQAQEIERLKQENDRLHEQLAEQAKRIADLERQLCAATAEFHHHVKAAVIRWSRGSTT